VELLVPKLPKSFGSEIRNYQNLLVPKFKNGAMAVLCEPGCGKMQVCLSVSCVLVKGAE